MGNMQPASNHPQRRLDGFSPVADADRRRDILIATCAALMAVVASASGLGVAQQDLALDLNASQSGVLWIINAYIVALAALLLPMGAIADRWGRKPVLVAGLVVFGVSTAAAGFVDTLGLMVAMRVIAGVSAAMIMPVTLSVITSSFPQDTRSQAIGVWSAVAGGGGLLGMIAAALLVDLASWRWLFALPVVLAVAALIMTVRFVPNSREHRDAPYDIVGALFAVVAVGGVVLGIHEGPERGWASPIAIAGLVGGIVATSGFIVHELRQAEPLLDLRAFRDRRLAAGSTALLLLFAISAGIFVVLFPFFQAVLGWTALKSILGLLPMIVVMMGASGLAAAVSARFGARATVLCGVGTAAVGLALMAALVSADGGYLSVLPGLLLVGLGMGLTQPPATESIISSLPPERQGVASALNDTTREVGSAIGIALLGAVLSAVYSDSMKSALASFPRRVADVADEGIGRAFDIAGQQHDKVQAATLIDAAQEAFVDGWAASIWVGAAVMGALFVFLVLRAPRIPPPGARTPAEEGSAPVRDEVATASGIGATR